MTRSMTASVYSEDRKSKGSPKKKKSIAKRGVSAHSTDSVGGVPGVTIFVTKKKPAMPLEVILEQKVASMKPLPILSVIATESNAVAVGRLPVHKPVKRN
jgi:hypothetical protein